MNLFLPRRPRGAHFVVLSNAACKVGRRIRQRGFHAGWHNLIFEFEDLRRLHSYARTGRVLPAVLCPSCASWKNCRASQTNQRWSNVWGQQPFSPHIWSGNKKFKRVITFIRDLQKLSHVWRAAPVCLLEQRHRNHSIIFDQCVCGTPWTPRTKLIAGHCTKIPCPWRSLFVKSIMCLQSQSSHPTWQ